MEYFFSCYSGSSPLLEKKLRKYYDVAKNVGHPIGVQIVGLPFEDETVLEAMGTVSRLIPFTDRCDFVEQRLGASDGDGKDEI